MHEVDMDKSGKQGSKERKEQDSHKSVEAKEKPENVVEKTSHVL